MSLPNLKKNNTGFTLIEIIAAILLMGIIAVFTIFFIVSGMEGYIFSKQNAALSRKASLAMARITKEFNSEMKEIELITISSVKYVYQYNPRDYRYVALVGTGERKEIKIVVGGDAPDDNDPEVLIDQVSNFTLDFKKCDDSAWDVSKDMDDLCKIVITLTLFINPTDDKTVTFTTTINPPSRHYIICSADSVFKPFKGKIYVANS
jgi:prepilin-type N-terminal cleavage/methylation domain-containing protein